MGAGVCRCRRKFSDFSDGDSASSDFSTTGRSDTPTAALGGGGVPSGVEDCSSESLKVTPANLSVKLRVWALSLHRGSGARTWLGRSLLA